MRFNDPEHNRAVYGDKFDPTLSEIIAEDRRLETVWEGTPGTAKHAFEAWQEHRGEHFPALVTEIERQASEIERLREVLKAKDDLLVAYRLGDQRRADKALARLAALNEKEPHADA